jgi:hypothetical protein
MTSPLREHGVKPNIVIRGLKSDRGHPDPKLHENNTTTRLFYETALFKFS